MLRDNQLDRASRVELADMVQFSGPVSVSETGFRPVDPVSGPARKLRALWPVLARLGLVSSGLLIIAASSMIALHIR